jgi:hypothetical protein
MITGPVTDNPVDVYRFMCMHQYILRKRNFAVICGDTCFVGWHCTILSKLLKMYTRPKRLNAVGTADIQSESFRTGWLKIEAFKDWLQPVAENQYIKPVASCVMSH